MQFGFVGLGQMGAPMAINLARKNDVIVYDRNPSAVAETAHHGAKGADEAKHFKEIDVLITCLPAAGAVKTALFDPEEGLAQHLKAGALVVDTSTIEYGATLEIRDRLEAANLRFLDAPVSGMQKLSLIHI